MASLGRRLWRWTAGTVAAIVILLGLAVGIFRIVVAQVPGYRAHIEQLASESIGLQVRIGDAALEWGWHGPQLKLRNVRLLGPAERVVILRADALKVSLQLDKLLLEQSVQAGHITLVHPVADVAYLNGQWRLAGVPVQGGERELRDWRSLLRLMPNTGSAELEDADIRWSDAERQGWRFEHLDLKMSADGTHYRITGQSALPSMLGTQVSLDLQADGPRDQPEGWQWQLQFDGQGLKPGMFDVLLGEHGSRLQGSVRLKLSAAGTGTRIDRVDGTARAADLVRVPLGPSFSSAADRSIDDLSTDLHWRRRNDGWTLGMPNFVLNRGGRRWPVDTLELSRRRTADDGVHWQLAAGYLNLEDVAILEGLLPGLPKDWHGELSRLRPRGEVTGLRAGWQQNAAGEPTGYGAQFDFTGIGWQASGSLPAVTGLSGSVALNTDGGRASLHSQSLIVDFPGLFRGPLDATTFQATAYWQRTASGWRLGSRDIRLGNDDIENLVADLQLSLPQEGSPVLDLAAVYRNISFKHKSRYFPTGIMSESLVHWLDSSVLGGDSPGGELIVRGPLKRFPFPDGGGIFHVAGKLRHARLQYAPDWPEVDAIDGDIDFTGEAFQVHAESATTQGMTLSATAGMPDMRKGMLVVRAKNRTSAEKATDFIRHSPLETSLGGLFDRVSLSGAIDTDFNMHLPVAEPENVAIDLDVQVPDGTVRVAGLDAPFEHVNETLHFSASGVSTPKLTAQWLGQPVSGRITDTDAATLIDMQGRTPVERLRKTLGWPVPEALTGAAAWQGQVRIAKHGGGDSAVAIAIDSDLNGVASALPAPFGKAADAGMPMHAELSFPAAGRIELRARAANLGSAWMRLDTAGNKTRLAALHLGLGREYPTALKRPGILIDGDLPALDLDGWLGFVATGPMPDLPPFLGLDLTVQQLSGFGQSIDNLRLQAAREADAWNLALQSEAIGGRIRVPDSVDAAPVRAELSHAAITLPENTEQDGKAAADLDPRKLPGLAVHVASLTLNKMALGDVRLRVGKRPDGLALTHLMFSAPHLSGSAEGSWLTDDDKNARTQLKGSLSSDDLGPALQSLGYPGGVAADSARVTFDLQWPGGPSADIASGLTGTLHLQMSDGQLNDVQPGAGRLLGLLSVAALPRRLVLDFSDVFSKGLSFDSISGDFSFRDGSAYTRNLTLKGPAASAEMVGRTGLVARDYDLLAVVNADISSSLPVAGALAAGPQVGAVMLLLSQLFKKPINTMARRQYHITGTWDHPVIEAMSPPPAKRESP